MDTSMLVGVAMLCLASCMLESHTTFWKLLQDLGWPVHFTNGLACIIASTAVASLILLRRMPLPGGAVWLVLRGVFGNGVMFCKILAVQEGASIGDVAALTSINMVFAAILGRIFLGEKLRSADMVAVGCSFCGATLITRPGFIFGNDTGFSLGHILALVAGFNAAAMYICGRKSPDSSPVWGSLAALLIFSVPSLCGPYISLAPRVPIQKVVEHPLIATSWVVATTCVFLATSMLYSSAIQSCPAAVSSITDSSASMFFGYVIELIVLGRVPNAWSLVGACLMMLGVAIMASCRRPKVEKEPKEECGETESVTSSVSSTMSAIRSIASFVATEFAEQATTLRRRSKEGNAVQVCATTLNMTSIVPEVLGSALS